MAAAEKTLCFVISKAGLDLLRKHDFPCSEGVLATARQTEEGHELRGSRQDLEDLVGWVAGEANHSRSRRQAELLSSIADEIEFALQTCGPR